MRLKFNIIIIYMLSSRNKRLKRISRIFAFFVIVFSGCIYQL